MAKTAVCSALNSRARIFAPAMSAKIAQYTEKREREEEKGVMDEREKKQQGDDKDHGKHEHHPEPKPEPPGRIIHPRPSHGDGRTR